MEGHTLYQTVLTRFRYHKISSFFPVIYICCGVGACGAIVRYFYCLRVRGYIFRRNIYLLKRISTNQYVFKLRDTRAVGCCSEVDGSSAVGRSVKSERKPRNLVILRGFVDSKIPSLKFVSNGHFSRRRGCVIRRDSYGLRSRLNVIRLCIYLCNCVISQKEIVKLYCSVRACGNSLCSTV